MVTTASLHYDLYFELQTNFLEATHSKDTELSLC